MSFTSKSPYYIFDNKWIHSSFLSLFVLITFYCLSSALINGAANALYYNAEFSINDWSNSSNTPSKNDYETTLISIKKAQSLDITHPHYAHMVGRIIHWGVDMGFEDKAMLDNVKQWYLLAAKLRPLWPDPWVDLLRLNNYLYGYSEETKFYIERALFTGPYIDLVTVGTLQVWLENWAVLSGNERAMLFRQFYIASKQFKVLELMKYAKIINRDKLLCTQLKFNKSYVNYKNSSTYSNYCLK